MRQNLPITQHEYVIPDGVTLVSTTDLRSHITYCNAAFVEVSGYSIDELIGQPHNLVRHPDMPEEAFRDMWTTLQAGRPWSALVKNRRKNGDHYWVRANATPIMSAGQAVGYMSVRTKPAPDQVQAAEAVYARMREESGSARPTLTLRGGELQQRGLVGWVQRKLRFSLAKTIWLSFPVLGLVSVLMGEWAGETGSWVIEAAVATAVLTLATTMAWFVSRNSLGPLSEAIEAANRMGAGDLTELKLALRPGEFGALNRALNQLSVNLRAVVSDVRSEVEGASEAAREIAAGNLDLSSRTESQASSLEEAAASMEELTSTVGHSATGAAKASDLSREAAQVAQRGTQAMGEVIRNMEEINGSSTRIAEIIQVIDGISFQTNILALNAAVEAARAGEQGRGFAVVAGEVRALAGRTQEAAKEIKLLIEASGDKVALGSRLVQETGSTIHQIQSTVERVDSLVSEIRQASGEQANGLSQINAAVSHLDSVTQQNAAMVEQLSAAATAMQTRSKAMGDAVGVFRLA